MIEPKYTNAQLQALMAMAAAGWETLNLVTQEAVTDSARQPAPSEDSELEDVGNGVDVTEADLAARESI